jgi:hypothetical protein
MIWFCCNRPHIPNSGPVPGILQKAAAGLGQREIRTWEPRYRYWRIQRSRPDQSCRPSRRTVISTARFPRHCSGCGTRRWIGRNSEKERPRRQGEGRTFSWHALRQGGDGSCSYKFRKLVNRTATPFIAPKMKPARHLARYQNSNPAQVGAGRSPRKSSWKPVLCE